MKAALAVALLLLVACADISKPDRSNFGASDPDLTDPADTPPLDTTNSIVPLSEIHFDTFDGGSISLAEATPGVISQLFDAIEPIDAPRYETTVDWMNEEELILGYVTQNGQPIAFPHKIMASHEIVNDTLDGQPVLVTYCPLCGSGAVYDRTPDDLRQSEPLSFSNTSALYENDLVMVDRETGTYWWQTAGRGLVGPLAGAELPVLPSTTATWEAWLEQHPNTAVLAGIPDRFYAYSNPAPYVARINEGETPFPVQPEILADSRLSSGEAVIGIIDDADNAWVVPIARLEEPIRVEIADTGITVLSDEAGIVSVEDRAGEPYPSRTAMWFSFLGAFPQAQVVEVG